MKVIAISFLIILVDQITKLIVRGIKIPFFNIDHSGINVGQSIPILQDVFHITLVENPGIAFGLTFGSEFKLVVSIFTIIASFGLLIYLLLIRNQKFTHRLSIAIILGGAVSNLIDRLFYGYFYSYAPLMEGKVVDFLDIRLFSIFLFNNSLGTYVFNIADLAITVGVLLLLVIIMRSKQPGSELIPVESKIRSGKDY